MKTTKKVAKKTVKKEQYKARIKVMGTYYEALGNSIKEAITGLEVNNARGMSILTLSKGDASKTQILPMIQTISLFSKSPLRREIALKQIAVRFDL